MGSINYSQAIKPDIGYIKKTIENSLLADWLINIECLPHGAEHEGWQKWDKNFFAIKSAQPVITALLACYEKNPMYGIRIVAEKFRPQSRLVYTAYDPQYMKFAASSRHVQPTQGNHMPAYNREYVRARPNS